MLKIQVNFTRKYTKPSFCSCSYLSLFMRSAFYVRRKILTGLTVFGLPRDTFFVVGMATSISVSKLDAF